MAKSLAHAKLEIKPKLMKPPLNYCGMKLAIANVRKERLNSLIKSRYNGKAVLFCQATGIKASQLSQWLTDQRNMGERSARTIEEKLRLPHRYLDVESDPAPESSDKSSVLSDVERDLVLSFRALPPSMQKELADQLMADAERWRGYTKEILEKHGTAKTVGNEDVAAAFGVAGEKK